MIFNDGMSIWIFTLVLLAACGAMGFSLGAIRMAFTFVGLLAGAFLAAPLSGLVKFVLPWVGVKNPVLLWAIAPLVMYCIIAAIFQYAAFQVHRSVDIHFKHKTTELEQSLWLRLNSRTGLCLGLLNGAAYLVLISFLIFNLSYWTTQVGPSANQPAMIRLVNGLGADLQATGLSRAAAGVGTLPDDYYHWADLAGFMIQNPQTEPRLEHYPGLTSLVRRPEMQPFFTDSDFTNMVATGGSVTGIWGSGPMQLFFANPDLVNTVSGIFETNYSDLTAYLQTGKSARFDGEKILGTWKVNIPVTLAWLRQAQRINAKEMRSIRAWYDQAYTNTTLLATGDGDVYVKDFPTLRKSGNPAVPPTTELQQLQGKWTKNDSNYDVSWKQDDQDKFYTGKADDVRLTLKDGRMQIVFDRQ